MKTNESVDQADNALSAWLLHQKPAKNTTTQVFFLTRERGLIRAFCAGGRSTKKRAALQPFTPLWLTLNEKHYGAYVKQVEISAAPILLTDAHLLAGLYLNELLYRALKPEFCDVRLFEAYEVALRAVKNANNQIMLEIALRRFEHILIDVSGYAVSYEGVIETAHYTFLPGEGFKLADAFATQRFLGAHLLAIRDDVWDDAAVLKTAKFIMRCAINYLLDGVSIQTRALYQT
ncbi:MAG: recombination protein O N-terminal domain-containing protein [Legionella sp.]|nr:recombination protein O N-terminal domain-containing protein [Legionella sp.]